MNDHKFGKDDAFWTHPNTVSQQWGDYISSIHDYGHKFRREKLTLHDGWRFLKGLFRAILFKAGPLLLFYIFIYVFNCFLPTASQGKKSFLNDQIPVLIGYFIAVVWMYIRKVHEEGLPSERTPVHTAASDAEKPMTREEILARHRSENSTINFEGYPEFSEEKDARKKEQLQINNLSLTACFLMIIFLYIENQIITGEIELDILLVLLMTWMTAQAFAKWYYRKSKQELAAGILCFLMTGCELIYYFKHLFSGIPG